MFLTMFKPEKFTEGNGAFHYVTGHFNFQESVEEHD